MMKYKIQQTIIALSMVVILQPVVANEQQAQIALAQSGAHSDLSERATIVDFNGKVVKKGTSDWTCMPGIPLRPGDAPPMCNDPVWNKVLQAAKSGKSFTLDRIGISYMMQGDAHVSNSNPGATDHNIGDVWVQEGPHLMIIVPKNLLKGVSDDPFNGGPYVMWQDTPFAHIMIPVNNK